MSLVCLVLLAGLDAVAVSRDGKWLAAGGANRAAYVLDAFAPDGKRVLVLEQSHETADEKRVPAADMPPALRGLAREEFRQRNDGRASRFRVLDLAGKEERLSLLWYASDSDSTGLYPSDE